MAADVKLTPAQRRALQEIEAGHVSWSWITLKHWNHATKRYVHKATMRALRDRDLFALEPAPVGRRGTLLTHLTDRGREVIANG